MLSDLSVSNARVQSAMCTSQVPTFWTGGKHCWHWCGIADKHHYTWPCHRLHMSGGSRGSWQGLRAARVIWPTKAQSHGSTQDIDGYPKITWHPKRSCQSSEPLAEFASCSTLDFAEIIGLMSPDSLRANGVNGDRLCNSIPSIDPLLPCCVRSGPVEFCCLRMPQHLHTDSMTVERTKKSMIHYT